MRRIIAIFALVLLTGLSATAQEAEVLYFKANLPCCHARRCNFLEAEVKSVVESNFTNGDVVFKVIPLADESNKELVDMYSARSQTVVIVPSNGADVKDISGIVRSYSRSRNKPAFESELIAQINEVL